MESNNTSTGSNKIIVDLDNPNITDANKQRIRVIDKQFQFGLLAKSFSQCTIQASPSFLDCFLSLSLSLFFFLAAYPLPHILFLFSENKQ